MSEPTLIAHSLEDDQDEEEQSEEDENEITVGGPEGVVFAVEATSFPPPQPDCSTSSFAQPELPPSHDQSDSSSESSQAQSSLPQDSSAAPPQGSDGSGIPMYLPLPSPAQFGSAMRSIMIYPLDNYQLGVKDAQPSKDLSKNSRFARMKLTYLEEGSRRTAQAVMMVHRGGHPHVLLLNISSFYKLPGGSLKPGQDERKGLVQKLHRKMAPPASSAYPLPKWEIDDLLSTWWRPNFENYVVC